MVAVKSIFRHPVVRASLTSGTVMACGDVLCQTIRSKAQKPRQPLQTDIRQTIRFALLGISLHGPFFYRGFKWLDQTVGSAPTFRKAALKVALGQFTLFPVYTTIFFGGMGLLEGLTIRQCVDKVQRSVPQAFVTGCVFWPTVNMLNFMMVPPTGRVVYVNVVGLLWNAYLSWTNSGPGGKAVPASSGALDRS